MINNNDLIEVKIVSVNEEMNINGFNKKEIILNGLENLEKLNKLYDFGYIHRHNTILFKTKKSLNEDLRIGEVFALEIKKINNNKPSNEQIGEIADKFGVAWKDKNLIVEVEIFFNTKYIGEKRESSYTKLLFEDVNKNRQANIVVISEDGKFFEIYNSNRNYSVERNHQLLFSELTKENINNLKEFWEMKKRDYEESRKMNENIEKIEVMKCIYYYQGLDFTHTRHHEILSEIGISSNDHVSSERIDNRFNKHKYKSKEGKECFLLEQTFKDQYFYFLKDFNSISAKNFYDQFENHKNLLKKDRAEKKRVSSLC